MNLHFCCFVHWPNQKRLGVEQKGFLEQTPFKGSDSTAASVDFAIAHRLCLLRCPTCQLAKRGFCSLMCNQKPYRSAQPTGGATNLPNRTPPPKIRRRRDDVDAIRRDRGEIGGDGGRGVGSGAGEFRGAAAGAEAAAGAPLRSAPAPVARDGHTNASRRRCDFFVL